MKFSIRELLLWVAMCGVVLNVAMVNRRVERWVESLASDVHSNSLELQDMEFAIREAKYDRAIVYLDGPPGFGYWEFGIEGPSRLIPFGSLAFRLLDVDWARILEQPPPYPEVPQPAHF